VLVVTAVTAAPVLLNRLQAGSVESLVQVESDAPRPSKVCVYGLPVKATAAKACRASSRSGPADGASRLSREASLCRARRWRRRGSRCDMIVPYEPEETRIVVATAGGNASVLPRTKKAAVACATAAFVRARHQPINHSCQSAASRGVVRPSSGRRWKTGQARFATWNPAGAGPSAPVALPVQPRCRRSPGRSSRAPALPGWRGWTTMKSRPFRRGSA